MFLSSMLARALLHPCFGSDQATVQDVESGTNGRISESMESVRPTRVPPATVAVNGCVHCHVHSCRLRRRDDTHVYQSQTIPVTSHLCQRKLVSLSCSIGSTGEDGLQLVPLSLITKLLPSFQHVSDGRYCRVETDNDHGEYGVDTIVILDETLG